MISTLRWWVTSLLLKETLIVKLNAPQTHFQAGVEESPNHRTLDSRLTNQDVCEDQLETQNTV